MTKAHRKVIKEGKLSCSCGNDLFYVKMDTIIGSTSCKCSREVDELKAKSLEENLSDYQKKILSQIANFDKLKLKLRI